MATVQQGSVVALLLTVNILPLVLRTQSWATAHRRAANLAVINFVPLWTRWTFGFPAHFLGVQEADDEPLIPPIIEHSLLAAVTGAWPAMMMTLKCWLPRILHAGLQKLLAGCKACADLASACVQRRL